MNRIYRTLWSVATQSWQAVPETAKTAGKKSLKSAAGGVIASVALSFTLNGAAHAQAPPAINQLPTGGSVSRGTATISQTATAQAAAMTVNQSSQRTVVNWSTFNLGQSASINFVQPNAQAVTLNRVNDSNPSQIFGRITANGQVFLTNANGVYFSPNSSVDVGALTATTHSISDDNFMSGKYVFERNGATGKVVNEGNITAALSGYVALLAPEVQNSGVVVARAGTVAMAAGEMITLKVDDGGSLASLTTTPSSIATLIQNKQAVLASDGQIILSAVALNKLQAGVIKNSGRLEANSLVNKGGKIYLEGDDITLDRNSKIEAKGPTGGGTVLVGGDWQGSGDLRQATKVTMEAGATIDASATDKGDGGKVVLWSDIHNDQSQTRVHGSITAEAGPQGGKGGQIETSGHYLNVDNIAVSTKSDTGKSGEWLLDPYDITISTTTAGTAFVDGAGDDSYTAAATSTILASAVNSALSTGNVTLSTGASGSPGANTGNITLSSNLSWSTNNVLTLTAAGGLVGASTTGIAMTGGGGLVVNQGGSTSYAGIISGNGSVTKQGTGTLTLAGTNTYSGGTTISTGTLKVADSTISSGNVGTLGTGDVVNNATLIINRTNAYTLDNNISGSGNLWMNFAGATVTLTGNNTYSGTTTTYGMINIGNGGTTGSLGTGAVTLSNEFYGLTFNRSDNFTVANDISGGGTLTKLGTGTLTLSGNNSYTSRYATSITTITAGTLAVTSGTALSSAASPTTVSSGGTLDLRNVDIGNHLIRVNSGGTLKASTGSSTASGSVQIFGPATIDVSSGAQLTLSGSSASFSTSFVKQGAGTLTLSNNNTLFTAVATLNEGILEVGHANALSGTGGKLIFNGGTLRYGTGISVDLSNRFDTATANQNYRIDTNGQTVNFGSALSSVGGTLTKLGAGTLSLSGANTYNDTLVSAGTLQVGNAGSSGTLGTGAVVNNSVLSVKRTDAAYNLSNAISGSGSFTQAGTGTVTVSGDNSFTGGININAGNLQLGSANALSNTGTISFGGGFLQYATGYTTDYSSRFSTASGQAYKIDTNGLDITLASTLGGVGSVGSSLTKTGAGTLTLSGDNNYSGASTLSAGTLKAGSAKAFGTGSMTETTGAVVDLNGQSLTTAGGLTLSGTGISSGGALINSSTVGASYGGLLSLGAATTIAAGTGAIALTNTGTISGATFGLTLDGPSGGSIASIIGTTSGTLTKAGTGTWALTGANTYTGATTISAGTLDISSAGTLGGGTYAGAITNSGTLKYSSSSTQTLSGVISGTGTLLKNTNASILTLSGVNTYTGDTTIDAGTLAIGSSGSLRSGTYAGAIRNSGTFQYASSASQSLTGIISGSGNLIKDTDTTSALSLSGANTYTGDTTIGAGTLSIYSAGSLGSGTYAGAITNNGTFQFTSSTNQTLSGRITGTGSVTKATNATSVLTLAGDDSYSGNTTISAGTIKAASATAFGTSALSVSSGAVLDLNGQNMANTTGNLTLNGTGISAGGALINSSATGASYAGLITLGAASSIVGGTGSIALTNTGTISGGFGLTLGGASGGGIASIIGTSTATLTKAGAGTWTLSGINTYTGATTISAGTLALSGSGSIATSSSVDDSGTLDISATSSGASIKTLTNTGGVTLGAKTLTLTTSSGSYGGVISGTGGISLTASTGTMTLTGDSTFTGTTSIASGSTLTLGNGTVAGSVTGPIANNGSLKVTRGNAVTLSGVISGTGSLQQSGSGALTLTAANTYSGATSVSSPNTLYLSGNGSLANSIITSTGATVDISGTNSGSTVKGFLSTGGSLNLGSKTLTIAMQGGVGGGGNNSVISGTGGLRITNTSGTGTVTLGGINTYTGPTYVDSNSTLALGQNAGTAIAQSSGLELYGTFNSSVLSTSIKALTGTGTVSVSYPFTITNASGTFSGLINESNGPLTISGGSQTLTGNNTGLTASITVGAGATLIGAGNNNALGSGGFTISSGGTLDLQGITLAGNRSISLGGSIINSTASASSISSGLITMTGASTVDAATGGSLTISGNIGFPGYNLTKGIGGGTVVMLGANNGVGTTTINGGTLQIGSLTDTTSRLSSGNIINNGNLVLYRSGDLSLSSIAPIAGSSSISGTGNVTVQATGTVNIDRNIALTGANSTIYVEAGANSAANTSLVSDVTLTNTITTSSTGTIVIFAGSPVAAVSPISTASLGLKMAGATGSIKYKTYNANLATLSNTVVAGTRNFYYRLQPSLTITGATVTASKTYDGNTTATNAVVTGGTPSSATDGDTMGFTVTGATYSTADAGTGKSMTVALTTASTNAAWVVKGYNGTATSTNSLGTINKAPLSITALNDARFVTESDTAAYAGVTYSGFVNSESTSNLGGALTLARSNPTNNAAGNYTLTPGGWTSTNYDITYRTGTYTIVPANQLLVRVADTSAVYGTAPSYSITSAKYVMPDNSLIDLTSQLSYSGGSYSLSDGASGQAQFTLGVSNGSYSGSGNLNVGVWNTAAQGATTTSPNFSNVLTVVGTQTVTPRQLTVAATAANKAYDGTTTATLASMTDNRLTGDALTVTQTSATFADKNAGAVQTVTISGISASGLDAGNYFAPASTLTTTGTITQKALTLTGLVADSKPYDAGTQATMSSLGTLTGVIGIEDVHVDSASASSAFTDKNVGTAKTVNVTGLSLTGADIANYTLGSTVSTTANITAKALTVTGTSVADKIYDATTTATLSSGTLSGVASGDTVTLTQAGNFVDKNYSASPKAVTATDTISGADASNYTLTQPTGLTASISRADLSISGLTAVDRAYNATLVASLTGTPTITPLLTDTVSIAGTSAALFTTKDVGTGKPVTVTGYTFTGADSNNYNPIQPTGLTASISKASLTVSGVTGTDKVYDATTTATLTGTPTVTSLLTDSVSVAGPATGTFADKNVSASPIAITTAYTLAGTDAGNYNIVQPSGLNAYITPKALSMEGLTAPASKTYDGTMTATVSGNASLKTASAPGTGNSTDGNPYAGDLLTLNGSPVGTYNSKDVATASSIAFTGMTMSGASAGNYTLSSYAPYAATITPKDLTVKANNDANFFAIPTDTVGFNGVSYLGFITGESAANLSFTSGTAPTITSSLSAGQRSTPGTYTNVLTPSGINSGNYHPVYQSGDFTVIPADTLLIRAANSTVAYGTSASVGTPTASYYSSTYGLVGSLNVTRSGDAFNVTDITHGGSATVTLAPITTLAQMSHSGNAVVGSYNIGASSVTNLVGSNFSNSVTVAGTQTVTPKALTITATASNKVYDASNAATVSLSSSDALTGDLISYDKTAATFSDANAALAKTVTASGLTLSGTDAGNYSLQNTSTTTTADITQKLVQLTATKTYDGTTSLATNQVTITTGVGSETLTYSGATLASKNVASNATNTVDSITLLNGTGANAGLASNYTFTTTRGANNSATVNPASLTLAPVTDTKVYDGTQSSSQAVLINNSSGSSDVVSAQQEFASKDVLGAGLSTLQIKAGYTIKDSSNADMSGNYVVTSTATAAGTITPADIVVSGVSAANKTYDATRNANLAGSATVNAFSGDVVTVSGTGTGLFADKNVGTAKTVTVSGYTLSGTDAGNYNVVQPTGLTADITKADLTVSGITANNKVYDATTNATLAGNASVSALASDVVTVSGTGTGVFADKNAGTAKTVTVSGYTLSGTDAGNYNVVQPTGLTADITKAPLTVTADDAAKLFGNANPALTVALSGFVGSETLATSGVTGTGTATTTATLNTTAGTAVITPAVGTLAASNYDFTNFVDGTLTINAISSLNNNEVVQLIGSQLSALSSAQMAGFTATQLQVFSAQQLGSLSSTQLSGMTASQLGSLNSTQLQGIKPAQVALLNASQISGVTADQLASFSTSQLLALSASQIATLLPAQLSSLTPAQISLLTSNAAASLSPQQILSLSPEQIAAVSLSQVAALTVSELSALSNTQLQALTPLQIASIAPDHFAAFTPQQIMAMSITQVQKLSPEQLSNFTPAQVASISAAELAYFDARQLAAIGIYPVVETPKKAPVAVSNFEAAIPVMTAIATPVTSVASPAVSNASTASPSMMQPTASPAASSATVNTTSTAPRTGLLAITILHSTEAKPTTAGVAFEQDSDSMSLRVTAAPAVPPLTDKVVFIDKLTTFLVAAPNGEMVEFGGTLVNNRIIIVAPSVAAKRVALTEMNLVLAAAVTSLGKENRVMLASLTGVVLDLR